MVKRGVAFTMARGGSTWQLRATGERSDVSVKGCISSHESTILELRVGSDKGEVSSWMTREGGEISAQLLTTRAILLTRLSRNIVSSVVLTGHMHITSVKHFVKRINNLIADMYRRCSQYCRD
jgi:hypothetical protein